MESYRLNSKLVEQGREFVIQTINDSSAGAVHSTVYVDGALTEMNHFPHPSEVSPEDVLSMVKMRHGEKKLEVEKLVEAYREALRKNDPANLYHLGTAFYFKGYFIQARELFEAAVAHDPEYHQGYNYLGRVHLALGDAAEAVKNAAVAVRKRPAFADYHNNLGEALLAAGSVRPAVKEFEEALAINMYYADAYYNLGLALTHVTSQGGPSDAATAQTARASECFRKAAMIVQDYRQPEFSDALVALGSADLDRARELFELVREDRRERQRREFAPFYMKYVMSPAFISERAVQERIDYLHEQIQKNPTYVDLYAELSTCHLEQAKLAWQNAIKFFKQTLEINPSLTRVQAKLQQAEREYESMCSALSRIAEKG